jgi:hypothetical protein
MQNAQKLRSAVCSQVRRNGEVAGQSRSKRDRWTFYETITFGSGQKAAWSLALWAEEKGSHEENGFNRFDGFYLLPRQCRVRQSKN